jgi:hypothetical protein
MAKEETMVLGLLRIRKDLGKKVESLLADPVNPSRKRHGSLKIYMESLIAKDLAEREAVSKEALDSVMESLKEIDL